MDVIEVQKEQSESRRKLVKPRPAGARPQRHQMFPWSNLLKVPRRLLCPPQLRDVGSVRSFSRTPRELLPLLQVAMSLTGGITPVALIEIEDVLANNYLPPLSLRDFGVRQGLQRRRHLWLTVHCRAISSIAR